MPNEESAADADNEEFEKTRNLSWTGIKFVALEMRQFEMLVCRNCCFGLLHDCFVGSTKFCRVQARLFLHRLVVALSAPVKSVDGLVEIAMVHSFEIGTVTRRVGRENLMAMATRSCTIETLLE